MKSEIKCYKCKKEMDMTPVCSECGIIPLAEGSFEKQDMIISKLQLEWQRERMVSNSRKFLLELLENATCLEEVKALLKQFNKE